jgi:hypothetical protein
MRPWHLRAWAGMNVAGWWRVLWRNRFAVSPSRVPMALVITLLSPINSALGWLQTAVYGRRIAATELPEDPLFVLGHWRSGTTLLHELLVCDPRYTYPDTAACFAPNHFLLTGGLLSKHLTMLMPPQRPMDNMPIRWELPQEDEWALCNLGLPSPYLTVLFPNRPPQDREYVDMRAVPPGDVRRWQQTLLTFLKALTLRQPKRLVLKTPLHTSRVRTLLEMFPRARFVHVVRNPYAIFPSTVHTWTQLYRWEAVQVADNRGLDDYVIDTFARMYRAFEEDRPLVPAGQLCEVRYEDLVRDKVGELQRIYQELELGDFEQARPAIDEYLAQTASYKSNRFELAPAVAEKIATRWRDYFDRYGYAERKNERADAPAASTPG